MLAKYFVYYGDESFRLRYSGKTRVVFIFTTRKQRRSLERFLEHFEVEPFPWSAEQSWDRLVERDGQVIAMQKDVGPTSSLKFKMLGYQFVSNMRTMKANGFTFTETNRLIE